MAVMKAAFAYASALFCVVTALSTLCGYAQAETFKDKGGQAYYLPVTPPEDTKQPDGSILRRVSFVGIIVGDLPFPFDYGKHHCTGTTQISADGKPGRGHGYCEVWSTKGDRASFTYVGEGGAGEFSYFDGSGAYAGIKGGGTYKTKVVLPTGGFVNEWVGTWQTN